MTTHWSVAQIFSKREPLIRRDVEAMKRHAIVTPTYCKRWYIDGKQSETLRPLFPGYLLFETDPNEWGEVAAVEGVIRVLGSAGIAGKLPVEYVAKMIVDDYCGAHNVIEASPTPEAPKRSSRRRRRRPRLGKRARSSAMGAAA